MRPKFLKMPMKTNFHQNNHIKLLQDVSFEEESLYKPTDVSHIDIGANKKDNTN
jgi:hypothetical protein